MRLRGFRGWAPGSGTPLIVMVHPLPELLAGPPQTLAAFIRYLERGHDVAVAAPEGPFLQHFREIGSSATLVPLPLYPNRQLSWAHGSMALLSAFGDARRPVLIHANTDSGLNLAGPLAIRVGAPVFVHFHAPRILRRSRAFLQTWRRLGVRMAFYPVSNFSWGLLETTGVRDLVRGLLPNPIECSIFNGTAREQHQPFRIGFVGRELPVKGLHRLIQVAALLKHEDVEWHVYGIDHSMPRSTYLGRCLKEIRTKQLEGKIRSFGLVKDVASAYQSMDALLVPSGSESFGRVAAEGMASGLPVVASRVVGLSEVVWDGNSGLLFDPNKPWEAAALLRRVIHDRRLKNELSREAPKAASRFDIGTVGPALEAFYEDLLDHYATPEQAHRVAHGSGQRKRTRSYSAE